MKSGIDEDESGDELVCPIVLQEPPEHEAT
jgi:hypothetical protein